MLRAQLFMWYGLRNVEATFCSWEKNTLNLNVTNCLELTHVEFHRPSNILFRLKIYAKPPNQLFVQKPEKLRQVHNFFLSIPVRVFLKEKRTININK
jgi:hypothetical protein